MGVAARASSPADPSNGSSAGVSHGEWRFYQRNDSLLVEVALRPVVAMGLLDGVPYACALGVLDGLCELGVQGAGVSWPHDLTLADGSQIQLDSHAAYDDLGVSVTASVRLGLDAVAKIGFETSAVGEALSRGMTQRVDSWAAAVRATGRSATPLGPILSEYFDAMPLMSKQVYVVGPRGNVVFAGTLAGIDVWGRATVVGSGDVELEISPGQAWLRAAS